MYCLENLLRDVVIFVKGIKSNVEFYGKKYYVDVVVVELSWVEVDVLRDRGIIELVGIKYFFNGNCIIIDDIKKV